ncbi:phosphonate C-P lyase system protein PhnH [Bacillus norwichensis]|uniref:Phosphonate C-P lyase system protein PhnH n=1 Tax=Bacillus norwichensis TaxID=2762217 RepID=A0ABR8VHJ4_9BACI|nr:phosphonate C-P lyase system protein PhnH [Bacillus norwichensis]MBD8004244.1 phosphonate C-P lyase system protein PhnH [Bacillus norwichensis]
MSIDLVHDIQKGFRTILHCMSRPGTIKSMEEFNDGIATFPEGLPATFITALTLLDREVSFALVGKQTKELGDMIAAYTMSVQESPSDAEYVFITKQATKEQITNVFQKIKMGTLVDPQQSATIILETEFSNEEELTLEGPGIKTTAKLSIANYADWIEERQKTNKEYPLGIDMILVDERSNIACIPRTTVIKMCEV